MSKNSNANKLAKSMLIAMVCGLACGLGFVFLRNYLNTNGGEETWSMINRILFADINASNNAIGIFYILGQLFVRALQLVIVPMIFASIALAVASITDKAKLGRLTGKTIGTFFLTSAVALVVAGIAGSIVYKAGFFNVESIEGIASSTGSEGSNPLAIILNVVPTNIISAFSTNSSVLAVVFVGVAVGLCMNQIGEGRNTVRHFLEEVSDMITVFLTYVINKFGPYAIFILLTRTFAVYGTDYLKPAAAYMVTTVIILLVYLVLGYAGFVGIMAKLNPMKFVKKISKVAIFGFSTSSSAATLPLNQEVTQKELGVSEDVASFALPLGMTINMDGTAIMQVIAAIFVAAAAGYPVTVTNIGTIAVLALVASIGTPAAPGAGAIILFTILSGMGYTNDMAILVYSLIVAINRPIEMLVTALNVVGDAATCVIVAKSEGTLDEATYND